MNTDTPRDHLLSNKAYDVLKLFALIVFPAIGAAYAGLAAIWGLPAAEQVLATIVVVDTFLGVLIKVGDASYNNSDSKYDGDIDVFENADRTGYSLNFEGDPEDIKDMKEVAFRVNPPM